MLKDIRNFFAGLLPPAEQVPQPKAMNEERGVYTNSFAISFDGEKNSGDLGPVTEYILNYDALRLRGWAAYLDSEVAQTVISRYATWVVGGGLKLQCEPQLEVLEAEGLSLDPKQFNKMTEARFKVYADSRMSSYTNMGSLHELAETAYINAIVGGDVLVVQRIIDNEIKVELIDGAHVRTPLGSKYTRDGYVAANGNRIVHGIELTKTGEHAAYWVRTTGINEYERIPARGEKTGMLMAWMVYGLKYRLNNHRGLPLIVAVMETVKKLERYKEATVGSAEERQKVPYVFEHDIAGSGEHPLIKNMAKAFNVDKVEIPIDVNGNQLASNVAATTGKMTINMPPGGKVTSLDSKNELSFKDFYLTNFDLICATVNIPPNVAASKYDSNFSASRAALKDWEHTLIVKRKKVQQSFHQPVYNLWLHKEILRNKIHAPGYLSAYAEGNQMAIEAYRTARFVGTTVPHIDPVKEVTAERLKLGTLGASIPLTTVEAATEALNGGEASANMQQFAEELEQAKLLGLELEEESFEEEEESKEDQ